MTLVARPSGRSRLSRCPTLSHIINTGLHPKSYPPSKGGVDDASSDGVVVSYDEVVAAADGLSPNNLKLGTRNSELRLGGVPVSHGCPTRWWDTQVTIFIGVTAFL